MNATVASLQSNQSETTILPKFIKVKKGHNSIKILLMLSAFKLDLRLTMHDLSVNKFIPS